MKTMTASSLHSSWLACLAVAGIGPANATPPETAASQAAVAPLMQQDLAGDTRHEVVMLTVSYPPSGSSLPHRHDAQVFVYVLEGQLIMQVQGRAPVTLHAGETFYESPGDIHVVSKNGSDAVPAKFLVFMIKEKSRPGSRPVAN